MKLYYLTVWFMLRSNWISKRVVHKSIYWFQTLKWYAAGTKEEFLKRPGYPIALKVYLIYFTFFGKKYPTVIFSEQKFGICCFCLPQIQCKRVPLGRGLPMLLQFFQAPTCQEKRLSRNPKLAKFWAIDFTQKNCGKWVYC